jgi:hypothetical protein
MEKITQGLGALTLACVFAVSLWHSSRSADLQTQKIQQVEETEVSISPEPDRW